MYFFFGSADSVDVDVVFLVEELPTSIELCHQFCITQKLFLTPQFPNQVLNVNVAVLTNGVISAVFKGLPDELNNAILATYTLHDQVFPNPITQKIDRNLPPKNERIARTLLAALTKTSQRPQIKTALKSDFATQCQTLSKVLPQIIFELNETTQIEFKKRMAFQIGQSLCLFQGMEVYTKSELAKIIPTLTPYLYRMPDTPLPDLIRIFKKWLELNKK